MRMIRLPHGLAFVVALLVVALAWGAQRPAVAQEGTPAAAESTPEVAYDDADGNELALLAVEEVVDPVDEAPAGATPDDDERYALLALVVENTGEEDLPLDPATFLLRDDDGFLYGADPDLQDALQAAAATPEATAAAAETPFADGDLAPGEERAGLIGFAIREDAELAQVLFVPETGRLLILADLDEADGAAADRTRATAAQDEDDEDATATAEPTVTATPETTSEPTSVPDEPTPTTPSLSVPEPTAELAPLDTDGDGLSDDEEAALGTDPTVADTDGDGLLDGDEVNDFGTDPLAADGDGAVDPAVADSDGDGLVDADEATAGTDPFVADSDDDGVSDGEEVEAGADPLSGADPTATAEVTIDAAAETTDPATIAEPVVDDGVDSDGDGLSDAQEAELGTDPTDPDSDADGLPDGDEVNIYGTNPLAGDSDGDGIADIDAVFGGAVTVTPTP